MHRLDDLKMIKISRGDPYKILQMCSQTMFNEEIVKFDNVDDESDQPLNLKEDIYPVIESYTKKG
jgi:hypothetical protein